MLKLTTVAAAKAVETHALSLFDSDKSTFLGCFVSNWQLIEVKEFEFL